MKILDALKSLKFIFMPHYWVMSNRYSRQLDKIVLEIIDKNLIVEVTKYHAKLGNGNSLWIANYPYCYATPTIKDDWDIENLLNVRPSRLTIHKLHKHLKKFEEYSLTKTQRADKKILKDFNIY